jgi:uncharacterized membrane protein YhaH (DUF805 family)
MRPRPWIVFALAVGVMVLAGGAFVGKMFEFALTMAGDEVAGFGAVAVSTYLLGMLPLLLLMTWAVVTGRFRDVEAPKVRMLELDREIERGGELGLRERR